VYISRIFCTYLYIFLVYILYISFLLFIFFGLLACLYETIFHIMDWQNSSRRSLILCWSLACININKILNFIELYHDNPLQTNMENMYSRILQVLIRWRCHPFSVQSSNVFSRNAMLRFWHRNVFIIWQFLRNIMCSFLKQIYRSKNQYFLLILITHDQ